MLNGIYSMTFRGRNDWGMGMLLFQDGSIVGADSGGVQYDGRYVEQPSSVDINMTMTVPPGSTLVQGTKAQSFAYKIPVQINVSKRAIERSEAVLLDLPPGPVNVIFRCLRSL